MYIPYSSQVFQQDGQKVRSCKLHFFSFGFFFVGFCFCKGFESLISVNLMSSCILNELKQLNFERIASLEDNLDNG